jgi:hypothetical protein
MPILSAGTQAAALQYMDAWFCDLQALSASCGLSDEDALEFISMGAAPGVIYAHDGNRHWWSALAAYSGNEHPTPQSSWDAWYSPGASWWLRRARLLVDGGASVAQASKNNRDTFVDKFIPGLRNLREASLAYPECFDANLELIEQAAETAARSEWQAWISGAYGVCLKDFTAHSCIRKETLARQIKAHFQQPTDSGFSNLDILELTQELASLITPFSPWERATCTPGSTIDVVLEAYNLGQDLNRHQT